MAELTTIARPYAKAAFETADAKGQLAEWSAMLSVAALVATDSDMVKVLEHPALTSEQKAEAFIDICGEKLNDDGKNLVNTMASNKRLSVLPQVAITFEQLKSEKEKSVDVSITTAFALTDDQQNALSQALGTKLSRDIKVSSSVDKELLGGAIIRAGNLIIDGSVRGKLAKLAEAMNS